MADEYTDVSYATDERKFPGWVYIIMKVKGLKVKTEGGLFSKKKIGKNANIEEPTFTERSVLVKLKGIKDSLNGKNLKLEIHKLPYDIIPSSCYIQPDEDRILVHLKKSDSEQSWKTYIEGAGIDLDE